MTELSRNTAVLHDINQNLPAASPKPRNPLLVLAWSFGVFLAMNLPQYLGATVGATMGGLTFQSVISGQAHNLRSHLGQGLVAAFLGVPFAYLAIKFLWRRSIDWMRLGFRWRLALGGFLLGLALPLAVFAIVGLIGKVQIIGSPSRLAVRDLLMILAGSLCWVSFIAFSEETVFRGMVAREWASRWGWVAATLLGGLWFGAVHLLSMIRSLSFMSAAWTLAAGIAVTVLFVALYVRSRSLWLPIGFHAGWNLCLESILGVTISGKEPGYSVFQMNVSGPKWVTGGTFGIEASVVAIVIYLVVALVVLRFSRSTSQLILHDGRVRPV